MTRLPTTATNPQSPPLHGADAAHLETLLSAVERDLTALGGALRQHDSARIELHARDLGEALTRAIDAFSAASRTGHLTDTLRTRLVRASGQVATQRESLLRATVALDGALDVLLSRQDALVYEHPDPRGTARFRH